MERPAFPWLEEERPIPEVVSLRNVFLHVTKACNLRCSYCYFSASKPMSDEMTTEEFTRLWPELVAVKPKKIVFTGGEPLLRPDLLDLLRSLREADPKHHVLRCLNSNGHLVTRDLAQQLVGLVDEVRISVDALANRNDALRGSGNFKAAMRALEIYYSVGFEPKVLVTVTAASLPDLEELICHLIARKLTRINVNLFRPIGRGHSHTEWKVDRREVNKILRRAWQHSFPSKLLPPEPKEPESQCTCGVGQFLNIIPNGDVFPCHVLTDRAFRCGNVREQSLLDICHRNGMLGRLSDLNFKDLARKDIRLSELKQPHTCMGDIYANTKESPAWAFELPIIELPKVR